VLTAQEDGAERLEDEALLQRATALGRVLFSQDADLLVIADQWWQSGRNFAGVIYVKQERLTVSQLIDDLELLAHVLESEEARNRVYFLPL